MRTHVDTKGFPKYNTENPICKFCQVEMDFVKKLEGVHIDVYKCRICYDSRLIRCKE